ncbi:MAG: hypothetical protein ACRD1X_07850 [Vicinamibacteria bacterium]
MMHKHLTHLGKTSVPWDYVASAGGRLPLNGKTKGLGPGPVRPGEGLLVRTVTTNPGYDRLELASGEMVVLRPGDRLVGVAGTRQALRGFYGSAPASVKQGDRLSLLSLGGILGSFEGGLLDLGVPTTVEVIDRLGQDGRPHSLSEGAIAPRTSLDVTCPIIAVVGTSMGAGKTRAASELVAGAARSGIRVAAVKLTGVACLKDTLDMRSRGAFEAVSFLDAGLASTVHEPELIRYVNGLFHHLEETNPELIVAELGDGIIGPYGVDRLLQDPVFSGAITALVLTASDHVGAWGGVELLRRWGLSVDVITGPVTDSPGACRTVEQQLGVPAVNACSDGQRLFSIVHSRLFSQKS